MKNLEKIHKILLFIGIFVTIIVAKSQYMIAIFIMNVLIKDGIIEVGYYIDTKMNGLKYRQVKVKN